MSDNPFKREVMKRCAEFPCQWDQAILAFVIGENPQRLNGVLNMKTNILHGLPADLAIKLSIALGEEPMFWMRLHNTERLKVNAGDPIVEKRLAEIRERAANWKPGMHCKPESKAYKAGYAAGYETAKKEFQGVTNER